MTLFSSKRANFASVLSSNLDWAINPHLLLVALTHRKIPIISPGRYICSKDVLAGLIFGGAYLRRSLL